MRPESSHGAAPTTRSAEAAWPPGVLLGVAIVSLGLCGTVWLLTRLARFEYGLDQGIYAVVADVMLDGGAPYRDAWDFKPPGIFFVYALARALLGEGMTAVRGLEAAGFASLVVAFALLARRFAGGVWPGLLGGVLAASGHVWLGFWHTGQPESFGAVLLAWALVLATVPGAAPRARLCWAGAAALYALAALLKPPLGGGILVSFAFAVREAGWRRATPAFVAGGAVPVLLVLLYLGAKGALPDLYEALFVFTPEYTALNYRSGDPWLFLPRAAQFLLLRFSWLNVLGVVLLVLLPRLATREREGALHVFAVLFLCLVGIALQGRFFAYHYGAALALFALLAGWGLWKLVLLAPRFATGALALAAALLLLANANGLKGPVPGGFLERVATIDAGQAHNAPQRRVAAWLRMRIAPEDTIYVWGFQPMLYDLARRRPASRFIYNAPQRAPWYSARGRDALMGDLAGRPPAAILVESGDLHPGTAGTGMDSAATLERFPRLAALLARDYDAGEVVGDFRIHLRRASREALPAPP